MLTVIEKQKPLEIIKERKVFLLRCVGKDGGNLSSSRTERKTSAAGTPRTVPAGREVAGGRESWVLMNGGAGRVRHDAMAMLRRRP